MIGFKFGKNDRRGKRTASKFGIGLFIDETGAYTTVTSAVVILLVISLLFSAAATIWMLNRTQDVQTQSDVCALAGENVVSSYSTCATVMDACVLSMGLTGLCLSGVGLVGLFIPQTSTAAESILNAGIEMLQSRNEYAISANNGLQEMEQALPYLIAMHSMNTVEQADVEQNYVGVAIPYPIDSGSTFLDSPELNVSHLEEESSHMKDLAETLDQVQTEVASSRRDAWLADCGREGHNMQERAESLTNLSSVLNPDYQTSIAWRPIVGLNRTRSYYKWRSEHECAKTNSIEEKSNSAIRKIFYEYAFSLYEKASIIDTEENCQINVSLLPKNTDELKSTPLYTQKVWPTTMESQGRTVHYSMDCPGVKGDFAGFVSLQQIDNGEAKICETCHFKTQDVGSVASASTSIDNGYEYHLREYINALDAYEGARKKEIDLEHQACNQVEEIDDVYEEILNAISFQRPHIAPPGRYGCIAYVRAEEENIPSSLNSLFVTLPNLPARGAVSAAVLAPDGGTSQNNVLSEFVSNVRDNGSCCIDLIGDIFDVWGRLLVGYADINDELASTFDDFSSKIMATESSPISSLLKRTLADTLTGLGLQPVDLRLKKPVLTNTSNVLRESGYEELSDTQQLLRSLPVGCNNPVALARAIGYDIDFYQGDSTIRLGEIKLFGNCIPIDVSLFDALGVYE